LFFVLSKTIGSMLLPTNLFIELGLVGVLLLLSRFAPLGRKLVVGSVVLLGIAAFSPIGYILVYPLEQRFPAWNDANRAPDGIIVLGASIEPELSAAHGVPVVNAAPDRIIVAAALAYRYPDARIMFTGGSANLLSNNAREADYAGKIFESLGISKTRLIMERGSRNTYENALFSKEIAAPKPGQRWLLVTSAYHMPRSVGLFRKVGFPVEPYPVDWLVRGRNDLFTFTNIASEGLRRTDIGMREWLGLLAYWLTGRIDELLPGPVKG
jgi:uncharacterized SAM-binding protein YcdF (DUF218 family)